MTEGSPVRSEHKGMQPIESSRDLATGRFAGAKKMFGDIRVAVRTLGDYPQGVLGLTLFAAGNVIKWGPIGMVTTFLMKRMTGVQPGEKPDQKAKSGHAAPATKADTHATKGGGGHH